MAMTVEFSGPFFRKGAAPVHEAEQETVRVLVREGALLVQSQLWAGHGVRSGKFRDSIVGVVRKPLVGAVYARGGRKKRGKGRWLEGVASNNQTSSFKGYSMFRRGGKELERVAKRIADREVRRAVKELS